jgi:hypothetical protein
VGLLGFWPLSDHKTKLRHLLNLLMRSTTIVTWGISSEQRVRRLHHCLGRVSPGSTRGGMGGGRLALPLVHGIYGRSGTTKPRELLAVVPHHREIHVTLCTGVSILRSLVRTHLLTSCSPLLRLAPSRSEFQARDRSLGIASGGVRRVARLRHRPLPCVRRKISG